MILHVFLRNSKENLDNQILRKKSFLLLPCIAILIGALLVEKDVSEKNFKYLGQDPPGAVPQVFAPGLISKENEYEYGSVFSEDGTEFFYGVDTGDKAEIRYTYFSEGKWTTPEVLISHPLFSFNDPFLSNDENRLYYISDMPLRESEQPKDYDIWFSTRADTGWSAPVNAGPAINTDLNEYYISFTDDGSMYFASNERTVEERRHNYDIYKSPFNEGEFQAPERLGDAINTNFYEADVFVAPDESYVIFNSFRREGFGQGDLYISFKDEHGFWKEAQNMGTIINTSGHELCPFVTKDGKYFFYTSNEDIYWVDAQILNQFK